MGAGERSAPPRFLSLRALLTATSRLEPSVVKGVFSVRRARRCRDGVRRPGDTPARYYEVGGMYLLAVAIDELGPSGRLYPCPCCGYLTWSKPGSYDICPICGWEDDLSQLRFAAMAGGANRVSLIEGQRNYIETGSCDPTALATGRMTVRPPTGEVRDPGFRQLASSDIEPATHGVDQGSTYPTDPTALYYWRPPR